MLVVLIIVLGALAISMIGGAFIGPIRTNTQRKGRWRLY